MNRIICILLIFNCINQNDSRTAEFMKPIFEAKDNCFGKNTFCNNGSLLPLTKERIEEYVLAHNGIRSRIAERFRVANMLRVYWDYQLQIVSEKFLTVCNHSFLFIYEQCEGLKHLRQNHAHVKLKFSYLPKYFDTSVFTDWYNEGKIVRDVLVEHKLTRIRNKINTMFMFKDGTNFSAMANPNTYRFGCAVATHPSAYSIACSYLRDPVRKDYFQMGQPGTKCEAKFPRHSLAYDRLCAGDHGSSLSFSNMLLAFVIVINTYM